MGDVSMILSKGVLYHLLECCVCVEMGEAIFHLITNQGFNSDSFLGTHCIRMFARFGRLKEANHVFTRLVRPNVYAWSAIVFANATLGQSIRALCFYGDMIQVGVKPDSHTLVAVLKACTNEQELMDGMLVHAHVIEQGLESVDYIKSGLIGLYTSCHRLPDAQLVFDMQVKPNVILWTDLIHGYSENDCSMDAIALFKQMQSAGVEGNKVTHVCMVKACASSGARIEGMQIHSLIIEIGEDELQNVVGSSLVYMYGRFGMLQDARKIFGKSMKHDIFEWNAMIAGETQHACVEEVFQFLNQMQQHGAEPNQATLTCVLKACAIANALGEGKQVHAYIVGRGLEMDMFLTNALLNLYARCGDIQNVCKLFKMSDKRNVATWTVVIAGYAEHGHGESAFQFFEQMHREGIMPNTATFLAILSACLYIADLKLMHTYIVELGSELDAIVASSLISRYGECTSLLESQRVFEHLHERDIVNWNAIITTYAHHGFIEKAFLLFSQMQVEGTRPDSVTYSTMISLSARKGLALEALRFFGQMLLHNIRPDTKVFSCIVEICSKVGAIEAGKLIHGQIVESGLEVGAQLGEALVHMYVLCGGVEDAEHLFDRVGHRDVGIWNAMISGYMQIGTVVNESSIIEQEYTVMDGHRERAFQLYNAMNQEGVGPDRATFIYILKMCSLTTASDHGKQIYAHIVETGLDQDVLVANMLVQMYTEVKSYEDALHIFRKLSKRDVVSFNTVFMAWAQQSCLKPLIDGFHIMQQEGVKADEITFLSLLSACGHIGKEEEALYFFNGMREHYGIEPIFMHYTCMADLVGRNGHPKEGHDLLQTMPFRPNRFGLTSISTHSTMHGSLYNPMEQLMQLTYTPLPSCQGVQLKSYR